MRVFKVLCLAIKHQQHGLGRDLNSARTEHIAAQTAIVQNLQYYEHLSDPMAELLQILAEQYDYPQLTDDILRYKHCFRSALTNF
jgi:condensin complex subunit 1